MNDYDKNVRKSPCVMCGEAIGDEEWLIDDRSVWADEPQDFEVYIHDRCA